jgi:hypothetical protein
MTIYNLTSTYYLNLTIEDGTSDMVDEWNTNIPPPTSFANPRFIGGEWYDSSTNELEEINNIESAKVEVNINALSYLSSTDWYITRQAETGTEVPADVATKRAEARAAVVSVA